MIDMARNICGNDCEITIDTIDAHYWNYKIDPKKLDKSWEIVFIQIFQILTNVH